MEMNGFGYVDVVSYVHSVDVCLYLYMFCSSTGYKNNTDLGKTSKLDEGAKRAAICKFYKVAKHAR